MATPVILSDIDVSPQIETLPIQTNDDASIPCCGLEDDFDTEEPSCASEDNGYGTMNDEEFEAWFANQLNQHPLSKEYPEVFAKAPKAVINWRRRFRGDSALWKRLFKKKQVVKEFVEAAPILDALLEWVQYQENVSILDLASGKGYLSMMMSEILPKERVTRCVLIDKQWPMHGFEPKSHQINWDHIYGTNPQTGEKYHDTWPIPLYTSKQNLKNNNNKRKMQQHLIDPAKGPVAIVAVHLCGLLSCKAIEMMNDGNEKVNFFALKPCCLPDFRLRKQTLSIGSYYTFPGWDVCSAGRWKGNKWHGPPRHRLKEKFDKWCCHLCEGIAPEHKIKIHAEVQSQGGYQNTFLFAQREPITDSIWKRLQEKEAITPENADKAL